jgi:POT family proton-dependent oligopeptide transporter
VTPAAQVWERFSYYGMRALLVLYLTQRVFSGEARVLGGAGVAAMFGGAPRADASPEQQQRQVVRLSSRVYGAYTALVYLTPLVGGLAADRLWGQRRMVLLGGVLMAAGHAAMTSEALTFLGLLLIALGNGAFKPNISTQVGRLYAGDASPMRRDAAFSAFYCGINVGAALAPLVTGALADAAGFGAGFAAAGVGMLVGLAVVALGAKHLPPDAPHLRTEHKPAPLGALLRLHRARVAAVVSLAALNILFWATYEQQGDALALFIDARVARGGVPSAFFQSLNPLFILLLTPGVNALWRWQARRGGEPHQVTKMALGCALLALSFLLLALGCAATGAEGRTSAGWVVLHLLVLTLGELYLSPVGLSFVTQVAPPELAALLMGVWFLSSFFGNFAAGALGARYADTPPAGFWAACATLAGANAAALLAARQPIRAALAGTPQAS